MKMSMKVPRSLFDQMVTDLSRPHPTAFERVGFAFGRTGVLSADHTLILLYDYLLVADDNYIPDETVGAKINANAIREAMQKAMSDRACAFHVHAHHLPGRLGFSRTDLGGLTRLVPSFQAASPGLPHGAFLIGPRSCTAIAWPPKSQHAVQVSAITIVGFPMTTME